MVLVYLPHQNHGGEGGVGGERDGKREGERERERAREVYLLGISDGMLTVANELSSSWN